MRDADGQSDTVDALTVPDIISRSGITGQIDLLKCDIEGAEAELFENAADWLGRVGTMVVELHAPYSEAQFLADLDRTASDMWDCRTLAATKDFTVVLAHRRTLAPQVVGPGRRAEISAAPL